MTTAEAELRRINVRKFADPILRIIIIAALIWYLAYNLNFENIYKGAFEADFALILAALFLLPFNILFQYYKWKTSSAYFLGIDEPSRIWRSLFAGFSAAIFTPARIGEYFGRGIEFTDRKPLEITAAVFMDKLFTYIFVILFGIPGAFIFFNITTAVLFSLIIIFLITIVFFILKGNGESRLFTYLKRIKIIRSASDKLHTLRRPDGSYAIQMIIFSFLFYLCFNIQFVLLFSAFLHENSPWTFFSIAGLVMFVKTMIPNFISGDIGIRESAAVFFMNMAGKDPHAGFNASVFLFLINIAIPSAIGIIPLLRKKK